MDNDELKNDEIAALSAIYDDCWIVENLQTNTFSIILHCDNDTKQCKPLKLEFKLPTNYPINEKPLFIISAPWMGRNEKANLIQQLNLICDNDQGQCILYTLIEKAKEFLNDTFEKETEYHTEIEQELESELDNVNAEPSNLNCQIYHGEPFVDRRSTFQAHLALVNCVKEVNSVLEQLTSNKKVASATHNIWAYRIINDPNVTIQNCDDDGETHAGSRLLHLLEIIEASNVMVVVSRWYGGIQLGPDRFKHINNVARDLLVQHNCINNHSDQGKKNKK